MLRKRKRQEEESEINITPMMDIVFIMLIFFIVTTSFIKETGVDPSRPRWIHASFFYERGGHNEEDQHDEDNIHHGCNIDLTFFFLSFSFS